MTKSKLFSIVQLWFISGSRDDLRTIPQAERDEAATMLRQIANALDAVK